MLQEAHNYHMALFDTDTLIVEKSVFVKNKLSNKV